MNIDTCIRIGRVIKSHGVKGEVRVDLELKNPEIYKDQESVYVEIDGKLVPFFIEELRIDGTSVIIKFEGMNRIEDINLILNRSVYLEKMDLTDEDTSILKVATHESMVKGFEVNDVRFGLLGIVEGVEEGPQDRLIVQGERGEILIPVCEPIIKEIDTRRQKIRVDLPEGFLDIYKP